MEKQLMQWLIVVCLVWGNMLFSSVFAQEKQHEVKKALTPLDIPAKPLQDENRPKNWGVALELEGVPNFYRVTDQLYRSAQPTKEGMGNLKKYGFETVVSLRTFNSDRDEIDISGLGYERIYMQAWHLEEKDVLRFLQITTNPKRQPVLVHCQHGADRTGTVIAVYRIIVQDWDSAEAVREMKEGGYGYHKIWNKFVDDFFMTINATKLKQAVEQN